MAELSTVARPYAEAVFATAREDASGLEAWTVAMDEMATVSTSDALREAVNNPHVSKKESSKLFLSLLKTELNDSMKHFVELLFENGRFDLLSEINRQFKDLKDLHLGTACAEIVTAFPLEDETLKKLLVSLEKKFGHQLRPQVTVDQSLIGGVRVTVGDQVMDTSVQAQLAQLRTQMTS